MCTLWDKANRQRPVGHWRLLIRLFVVCRSANAMPFTFWFLSIAIEIGHGLRHPVKRFR